MSLPVVFYPLHQESILGYLWRLSTHNGFADVWKCIAYEKWPLKRSDVRFLALRPLCDAIASSTGLDAERIHQMLVDQHQFAVLNKSMVFDQSLQDWRLDSPRICHECLSTHGYIHSSFDNIPMRVCTLHDTKVMECCPNCNSALSWHRDLHKCCHQCSFKWTEIENETSRIGLIQHEWMDISGQFGVLSDELKKWKLEVGKFLIRAMRPNDLMLHLPVPFYAGKLSDLDSYFTRADLIYEFQQSVPKVCKAKTYGRFNAYAGLMLDKIELSDTFQYINDEWKSECPDALPHFIAKKYDKDVIRRLVDTKTLVKLLNIDFINPDIDDKACMERWINFHRKASYELIELLGIEPVFPDAHVVRYRYDVRQLRALVDPIEYVQDEAALTCVTALCPRLATYGGDVIQLVKDSAKGLITVYRKPGSGINPLYVDDAEYSDWLELRLKIKCQTPIDQLEVCRMTGLHWRVLLKHANDGVLITTRGERAQRIYFEGQSVYRFIMANVDSFAYRNTESYSLVAGN